tara:strand:- start:314 stop:526 length:213 start_codon:yes stop_codon:yes gene_type:complete
MSQGIVIYGIHEGCVHEGGGLHKDVFLKKEDAIKYMDGVAEENDRYKKVSDTEYRDESDILFVTELELHS